MNPISYNGLVQLVDVGIITVDHANINGASIDITMGEVVKFQNKGDLSIVNVKHDDPFSNHWSLKKGPYYLEPGELILAESREVFNLPNHIAAEYKLKSSMARVGLNHLLAGWCDPGWHDSTLTLEIQNCLRHRSIAIDYGMKIGQIIFWECEPVPDDQSYATKGRYNKQSGAQGSKGVF